MKSENPQIWLPAPTEGISQGGILQTSPSSPILGLGLMQRNTASGLRNYVLVRPPSRFPLSRIRVEPLYLLGKNQSLSRSPWAFTKRMDSSRMLRSPMNFILKKGCLVWCFQNMEASGYLDPAYFFTGQFFRICELEASQPPPFLLGTPSSRGQRWNEWTFIAHSSRGSPRYWLVPQF